VFAGVRARFTNEIEGLVCEQTAGWRIWFFEQVPILISFVV